MEKCYMSVNISRKVKKSDQSMKFILVEVHLRSTFLIELVVVAKIRSGKV